MSKLVIGAFIDGDGRRPYALLREAQLRRIFSPLGEDLAERAVLLLKRAIELAAGEQAGSPPLEN